VNAIKEQITAPALLKGTNAVTVTPLIAESTAMVNDSEAAAPAIQLNLLKVNF